MPLSATKPEAADGLVILISPPGDRKSLPGSSCRPAAAADDDDDDDAGAGAGADHPGLATRKDRREESCATGG
jgi:hypothetical protein